MAINTQTIYTNAQWRIITAEADLETGHAPGHRSQGHRFCPGWSVSHGGCEFRCVTILVVILSNLSGIYVSLR